MVTSSFAEKYGYGVGDEIVLHDEENDIDYGFTVDSVTRYTPAFYVFMTIDDARKLFGAGSDEYNVVFADKDLGVDPARLYATTTNKGRYRVGCWNICRSDEKYGCYDSYYLDTYIRSGNVFDDEGHD